METIQSEEVGRLVMNINRQIENARTFDKRFIKKIVMSFKTFHALEKYSSYEFNYFKIKTDKGHELEFIADDRMKFCEFQLILVMPPNIWREFR